MPTRSIKRREQTLCKIIAECSQRRVYLSMLEGETLRRDGVETWRTLCRAHQAERAALEIRDLRAERLAVRLMYSPQERRARDEEEDADRADQSTFGLRPYERETPEWEFADE